MPVKLKPDKVYWVGINSPSHKNFKTPSRQAAPWYIILFATRSADGKPTPIPEKMLARAKEINAAAGKVVPDQDKYEAENIAAEGWRLWQQRKLVESEEKFKQAIKKDPINDNAFQGLGWAQLNQGKKLNAKESFEKCIEINPSNAAALNGLGWIAYGQGKKDEAITWWKKAVTANPGTTASLSGLTKVYMERKDYGKAVKYYQMWLDVEPNSAEAKSGLAKAKSSLQHK